jgi:hypothetical protein
VPIVSQERAKRNPAQAVSRLHLLKAPRRLRDQSPPSSCQVSRLTVLSGNALNRCKRGLFGKFRLSLVPRFNSRIAAKFRGDVVEDRGGRLGLTWVTLLNAAENPA